MNQEENSATTNRQADNKPSSRRRIDPALVISIFALAISLVGTIISLVETSILRQQQDMAADQMAASVWPYLDRSYNTNYEDDSLVYWTFKLKNNGTGPAIIGGVEYVFENQSFSFSNWVDNMYPRLDSMNLDLLTVTGFDDGIISPGESIEVVSLRADVVDNIVDIVSELPDKISVKFCYCSIYGACWESIDGDRPKRNKACEKKIEL
ncbi:MAG: hypothetical protein AAF741_03215 [Bacteroidota bacterium]